MSNYIPSWLVLGPIFSQKHQSSSHQPGDGHPLAAQIIEDIDTASISPRSITRSLCMSPQDGESASYCSNLYEKRSCTWKARTFKVLDWENPDDTGDDIHRLHGEFSDKHHSLAFFLIYIHSPEARKTELRVRNDDSIRVWLNGDEIEKLRFIGEMELNVAERSAEVCLYKGTNILMAAIAETHYEWGFSARFANDEGLEFTTLKPDAEPLYPPGHNPVIQSLKGISDTYSIFEKDQLLTHDQLNSITEYFDDQTRLTRVNLIGVGILCGFDVSSDDKSITVGKGVGVTTDGDLVVFPAPRIFPWFRTFGEGRPPYAPFYRGDIQKGELIELYELMAERPLTDEEGTSVGALPGIREMAAILYVESYITDRDICSATDCDNLGQERVNRVKVLLCPATAAELLNVNRCGPWPPKLDVDRPVLNPLTPLAAGISNKEDAWYDLIQLTYLKACEKIKRRLCEGLSRLGEVINCRVGVELRKATVKQWIAMLEEHHAVYAKSETKASEIKDGGEGSYLKYKLGIQYYYDFLKDLVEVYNAFIDVAPFGGSICSPDINWFPKHLLVGAVDGKVAGTRTPFYPAPAAFDKCDCVDAAGNLMRKIDEMLRTFSVPEVNWVGVTPSRTEEWPPQKRATPYYYQGVNDFEASRIGFGKVLYRMPWREFGGKQVILGERGSRKSLFGDEMDRQEALKMSLGSHSFFRIEGHLGQEIEVVVRRLRTLIRCYNLPFSVLPVSLKTSPLSEEEIRLDSELDSKSLNSLLKFALESADVDRRIDIEKLGEIMAEKYREMLSAERNFRIKTEFLDFSIIFDCLNFALASGLSIITKDDAGRFFERYIQFYRNIKEWVNDRDSFMSLMESKRGAEHYAGVSSGGTFVVVDYNGIVIADFMFPYYIPVLPSAQKKEERELFVPQATTGKGTTIRKVRPPAVEEKPQPA
ncbi:MAG: hypothetical protein HYS23_01845 [Geobacter sp.]|nr:hypothetical protein [Geobacter sp.]